MLNNSRNIYIEFELVIIEAKESFMLIHREVGEMSGGTILKQGTFDECLEEAQQLKEDYELIVREETVVCMECHYVMDVYYGETECPKCGKFNCLEPFYKNKETTNV